MPDKKEPDEDNYFSPGVKPGFEEMERRSNAIIERYVKFWPEQPTTGLRASWREEMARRLTELGHNRGDAYHWLDGALEEAQKPKLER